MNTMMKCGCAAQGHRINKDGSKTECCLVHECYEPVPAPDLTGRIASCSYGRHADIPSRMDLAFFQYRPGEATDEYYCGCFGWD